MAAPRSCSHSSLGWAVWCRISLTGRPWFCQREGNRKSADEGARFERPDMPCRLGTTVAMMGHSACEWEEKVPARWVQLHKQTSRTTGHVEAGRRLDYATRVANRSRSSGHVWSMVTSGANGQGKVCQRGPFGDILRGGSTNQRGAVTFPTGAAGICSHQHHHI